MITMRNIILLFLALTVTQTVNAKKVYQTPEEFLAQTFSQATEAQRIFIKGELAQDIKKILGHRYKKIRVPYWQQGCRSAWILEEIGKERYITTGFVINSQGIEKVKVLVFRESRGWEVKHDFFTDQFVSAQLNEKQKLNRKIDNIAGATMSVRAVTDISRMALLLHEHVMKDSC